jgi:hypothetical protein
MGNLFIDLYILLGDEIAMLDLAAWTCQGGPTVCAIGTAFGRHRPRRHFPKFANLFKGTHVSVDESHPIWPSASLERARPELEKSIGRPESQRANRPLQPEFRQTPWRCMPVPALAANTQADKNASISPITRVPPESGEDFTPATCICGGGF